MTDLAARVFLAWMGGVLSSCLADKTSKGAFLALFSGTYVHRPGPFSGGVCGLLTIAYSALATTICATIVLAARRSVTLTKLLPVPCSPILRHWSSANTGLGTDYNSPGKP